MAKTVAGGYFQAPFCKSLWEGFLQRRLYIHEKCASETLRVAARSHADMQTHLIRRHELLPDRRGVAAEVVAQGYGVILPLPVSWLAI